MMAMLYAILFLRAAADIAWQFAVAYEKLSNGQFDSDDRAVHQWLRRSTSVSQKLATALRDWLTYRNPSTWYSHDS
jgi:hypothetical protein